MRIPLKRSKAKSSVPCQNTLKVLRSRENLGNAFESFENLEKPWPIMWTLGQPSILVIIWASPAQWQPRKTLVQLDSVGMPWGPIENLGKPESLKRHWWDIRYTLKCEILMFQRECADSRSSKCLGKMYTLKSLCGRPYIPREYENASVKFQKFQISKICENFLSQWEQREINQCKTGGGFLESVRTLGYFEVAVSLGLCLMLQWQT